MSIIDNKREQRNATPAQDGGMERLRPLSVLSVTLELVRSRASSALLRGNWDVAAYWEERAVLAEERLWDRLCQPER